MSDLFIQAARAYASRGWRVFPLNRDNGDGKTLKHSKGLVKWQTAATTDLEQIEAWWGNGNPNKYGIAIVAGPGFSILDADPRHNSDATLFELSGGLDDYTNTPTVSTPTKGSHFYYVSSEDRDLKNWTDIGPHAPKDGVAQNGLDLRTNGGGYVVAPPTERHDDPDLRLGEDVVDGIYEWVKLPSKTPMIMVPDWVHEYVKPGQKSIVKGYADTTPIVPGGWHNRMLSIAGREVVNAQSEQELAEVLLVKSENRSHPDYKAHSEADIEHLRQIAHDVWALRENRYGQTEEDQADFFADWFGNRAKYNWKTKDWMVWKERDGRGLWWEPDAGGKVRTWIGDAYRTRYTLAKKAYDQLWNAAVGDSKGLKAKWVTEHDNDGLGAELAFAKLMGSYQAQEHVRNLAGKRMGKKDIEWDSNPFLIGVANGVVDLRTGKLEEGHPDQMISKHIDIDYHEEGRPHERWLQFISEIMVEKELWVLGLQSVLGYSLTGLTSEQVWFLCYGGGSNGKSTLLEDILLKVILESSSSYGSVAAVETFTRRKNQNRSNIMHDVAMLEGARVVVTKEPGVELVEFDDERMKSLTTGGRVWADKKHKDARQFNVILKLLFEGNHLPKVKDMSEGFWRRVIYLAFLAHFELPEKLDLIYADAAECPKCGKTRAEHKLIDKNIVPILTAEKEGILWWLVQGAVRYFNDGKLQIPIEWRGFAEDYREDQDWFGQMISEAFEETDAETPLSELHQAFAQWCHSHGREGVYAQNTFGQMLKERLPRAYHKTTTKRYWSIKPKGTYNPPPTY